MHSAKILDDKIFDFSTLLIDRVDASSRIVVARSLPTANRQDEDAVNAIFNRRRAPLLRQSRNWPPGFRANFFT